MSVAAPRRWLPGILLIGAALAPPAFGATAQALTLPEALARAESFSPLLAAAGLDSLALDARKVQALRPSRPVVGLDAENLAGTGETSGLGASEWVLTLAREFDLAGRRTSRAAALEAEFGLLDADRRATRLDLRLETSLAFGQVWRAQHQVRLAREQVDLARLLLDQVAARLAAGGSSAMEMTRARVGAATQDLALAQAEAVLATDLHALASLWGGLEADFAAVVLPDSFWTLPAPPCSSDQVAANPDLTRWDTLRTVHDFRLRALRAEGGLTLELAAGLKLDNATGDKSLVLGGSLPLPGGDPNGDELRALGFERDQTGQLKREATQRTLTALSASLADRDAASREMQTLEQQIIPLASQAHQEASQAHERGLYSLTDVLETRRNLFELRQAELDARHRFFTACVRIARLTGRDLVTPSLPVPEENR